MGNNINIMEQQMFAPMQQQAPSVAASPIDPFAALKKLKDMLELGLIE